MLLRELDIVEIRYGSHAISKEIGCTMEKNMLEEYNSNKTTIVQQNI